MILRQSTVFLLAFTILICTIHLAHANDLLESNQGKENVFLWQEKSFKGHTGYKFVETDGSTIIRARCDGTASALYKYMKVDLIKTPMLRWSWRIEGIHAGLDDVSKTGDDYAARVYVIFKGKMPWDVKAINYVWANSMKEGSSWPNAFTSKSIMVAQKSGAPKNGEIWVEETRNVREDFMKYFDMDISRIDGVAIMTDCDNSGGRAAGHYRDIQFSAQ